jgi:hypothetical protein
MSSVGFTEPLFFFTTNQCDFVIQTAIGKSIVDVVPHNAPPMICKSALEFSAPSNQIVQLSQAAL